MPTSKFFYSTRQLLIVCLTLAASGLVATTGWASPLVSNVEANALGLVRSWFAQVRVDGSHHKVEHWVLDHDDLLALTSAGAVQSLNAETGATQWTVEVGRGYEAAAGIAVNDKYVAVLGAGRLYMIDRQDGHQLWSRQVDGGTSAAPALSKNYAFVTLLNGRVEGHHLRDLAAPIWQYQSFGRVFQSPTTTGAVVSWPTDSGLLYVAKADRPQMLFRVETNDEIVAAPAEMAPYLYVGSLDGYLYCFNELSGSEQWRYSTGFAITSTPAIVGERAYVSSEGPSLHAVNAMTGKPLWQVEGATQFAAFGKAHTYCLDAYGQLIVLDNELGNVAGRLSSSPANRAIVNEYSDRIYLVNDRGLVQCLHEIGVDQPIWHRETAEPAEDAELGEESPMEDAADAVEAVEDEPADTGAESPFEAEEAGDGFDFENPFE